MVDQLRSSASNVGIREIHDSLVNVGDGLGPVGEGQSVKGINCALDVGGDEGHIAVAVGGGVTNIRLEAKGESCEQLGPVVLDIAVHLVLILRFKQKRLTEGLTRRPIKKIEKRALFILIFIICL